MVDTAAVSASTVSATIVDNARLAQRILPTSLPANVNRLGMSMWPTYYALTKLTSDDESRIVVLIKEAAS